MRGGALLLVAGAALAMLSLAGRDPLVRVLSATGLPSLGAALSSAPGEALLRAGRFTAAADAFAAEGARYNEGVAAAYAGDYGRALLAWDAVLAADPSDAEARTNHAIVRAVFADTRFDAVARPDQRPNDGATAAAPPGQGKTRAAGQGDEARNAGTGFWMPELTAEGVRRVPHLFDAQSVAADRRWLETLSDQPGRYLAARLAAEQKARISAGTALPQPEDTQ